MKRVLFLILIINLLFLATCKEERIMISFNPNNGEDIILIEFKDGDFNLPTDPNKDGYKFIGWYYDDQVISLDNIKTGMVLVARYEKIETFYNVYFDSNGGDYILPLKVLENDLSDEIGIILIENVFVKISSSFSEINILWSLKFSFKTFDTLYNIST